MTVPRAKIELPGGAAAATVVDVARRAGVSAMTVSRALNEPWRVKAETRTSVFEAVHDLSYTPNAAARTLAGVRRFRFGLLHNNPQSGSFSAILLGFIKAAVNNNVDVVIEDITGDSDPLSGVGKLVQAGIDGVILPPPLGEDLGLIDAFHGSGIPMVSLTASVPDSRTLAVHIDDDVAAEGMTRHLLALGHRQIAFIGGNAALSASARRYSGYLRALEAMGLRGEEQLIFAGDYTYLSGLEAAEQLFAGSDPPTAVFACNDEMAAAVISVAHRLNLDVPADLTVCAFEDTMLATTIWPQLTSIRQPLVEMTSVAVGMLLAELSSSEGLAIAQRHRVYSHELIRRQSDAAPRRRPSTFSKIRPS